MIRLILIDVDGTLVGKNGVHATTWDALARARDRGVHVGLCTGRIGCGSALEYARRVSPDGLHIFQSGAVVSRPGQRAEYAGRLPAHALPALAAISRRERVPLEVYGEARFFLEFEDELTRVHATHLGMEPEIASLDALPETPVRAQWVVRDADWPRFREWTMALGGIDAHPATAPWSPGTVFSNLVGAGTSKASALRWLAARHEIGVDEVAMVGDGENDLDAIEAAGLGIAMGNAPPHVRSRAGAVVGDVDEGGLAEAIDVALASDTAAHVVPIEDAIDLHSFLPRDVPDVVRDYLQAAREAGLAEVRVIHGRGIGVQRERVRELLAAHPDVVSFGDAPAERGHWGATVVRLRAEAPGN